MLIFGQNTFLAHCEWKIQKILVVEVVVMFVVIFKIMRKICVMNVESQYYGMAVRKITVGNQKMLTSETELKLHN